MDYDGWKETGGDRRKEGLRRRHKEDRERERDQKEGGGRKLQRRRKRMQGSDRGRKERVGHNWR